MGRVIIQSKMTLGGWRERQREPYTPKFHNGTAISARSELLPELESWNGWVRPAAVGHPIPERSQLGPPLALGPFLLILTRDHLDFKLKRMK